MAFWGVEVKPGKPYSHRFDASRGRLHVSQATIGISSNPQKSIVQCNVGDKSPVLLCRLIPDRTECCTLDLEFEEDDEVVFSVLGSRSVHLTGYYLGKGSRNGSGNRDGDDTDSYGEDIRDTESEQSNNSEEDEYEDDFIDDGELESPPSPMRKSKVVIEEILDDEKPVKWNVNRKRLRKTYQVSDSDSDDGKRIVVKGGTQVFDVQSEDEDDLPNSFLSKTNGQSAEVEEKSDEKVVIESKKKTEDAGDLVAGAKRNNEEFQDCETKRVVEQPNGSSLPSSEVGHETNEKQKKRKKKERGKDKTGVLVDDKTDDVSKEEPVKDEVNKKPFTHKTEDGSAEVKEKSDKKVVKASKKKHKDCVDEVTDAKRTEDVSVELKEKSDGKVIKASKKKVGNGGDQVSSKKKAADGGDQVTGTKRKVVDVIDSETERIDDTAIATNLVAGENTSEKKKRKKKKKNKTAE